MRDQNHTLPHTVIKSSLSPKFQKQTKMYKIMFWARTCTGTSNLCISWLKWAGSGKKECFRPAMASNNCAGTFTLEKLPVFLVLTLHIFCCKLFFNYLNVICWLVASFSAFMLHAPYLFILFRFVHCFLQLVICTFFRFFHTAKIIYAGGSGGTLCVRLFWNQTLKGQCHEKSSSTLGEMDWTLIIDRT